MHAVLTCQRCGAKLKLNPITLRLVKEVQCSKCRKHNPIPPELKAKAGTGPGGLAHPASAFASAIWFECSGCGKRLNVKKQYTGKMVKCRGCGKTTRVPVPMPKPEPEAEKPPLPQETSPSSGAGKDEAGQSEKSDTSETSEKSDKSDKPEKKQASPPEKPA